MQENVPIEKRPLQDNFSDSENKPSDMDPPILRLFSFIDSKLYSLVENGLMRSLPAHILEAYRLTKAIRITHVIQLIVPQLIHLGVTGDIHNLIRSYHLKTCVFILTQNYECNHSNDKESETNNKWTWAIWIYEKLREIIMLGNVHEFFATDRKVLRENCQHSEAKFSAELPRFLCCRVRKARHLVVNQIICVLRLCRDRYA